MCLLEGLAGVCGDVGRVGGGCGGWIALTGYSQGRLVFSRDLPRGLGMAPPVDDTVSRLLSHLSWLIGAGEDEEPRTLGWARRIYNSATHLQFRLVYPHQPTDRVATADTPELAKAIEHLVDVASDAVVPLRGPGDWASLVQTPLSTEAAQRLANAVMVVLDLAKAASWGGPFTVERHPDLDRPVDPVRLLAEWRRRSPDVSKGHGATTRAEDARDEFSKGLATVIVARHSPSARKLPAGASRIFREVAEAYFGADVDALSGDRTGQPLQTYATNMLHPPHDEGR